MRKYAITSQNFGFHNVGEMATKEFDILILDGSNFPSWAMDLKVNLSTLGLYRCIDEIEAGIVTPSSMSNYSTLKVMRNHIHQDLKIIHVCGGSTCLMDSS